jgi:hypothetical protein
MNIRANRYMNVLPPTLRPAWVAFGIWLRVVMVGVGVIATAAGLLIERHGSSAKALVLLAAGSALTALAWHRTGRALDRVNYATASTVQGDVRKAPFGASDRSAVAT